jgi:hypothetical protein
MKPEIRSAYSSANPFPLITLTVSLLGIPRIDGDASEIAAMRARDRKGLKPWRLAGARRPNVATGVATSNDCGLGVDVVFVSHK